ncbi:MAG: NAD(P)H-dependent oxidoreductase [Defluviitaleaceae bacterium]|nr:NAD(P)H-dependent oxidoreductase [Defluviitaleaceae bacterium]MCL2274015.1 NAD(P)H-dependent oxidoreductase [Defluviitaleaceae bacterium]MCL2274084.1 NAD(P)H-dependent oxidoreductase [Defluviitaleaceae bacterium]
MFKILIVNATPKTDGLCYSFVEVAEETADALGIHAETIRLAGYGLRKCMMCHDGWGICFKEHTCLFGEKDGFAALQQKVNEADAFVYITPVYWGEISEELKIFWDKLRRCETTKQWNGKEDIISFHKNKPSILVASAGGGGGGIPSTFTAMERAVDQLGEHTGCQNGTAGIFDYIGVTRWNAEYKRTALKEAIKEMVALKRDKKIPPVMNHPADLEKF